MRIRHRSVNALVAGLLAIGGSVVLANETANRPVNGTIWVANRGNHTIRGFDAGTGAIVHTVAMAANSQPGDLAYAKGSSTSRRSSERLRRLPSSIPRPVWYFHG